MMYRKSPKSNSRPGREALPAAVVVFCLIGIFLGGCSQREPSAQAEQIPGQQAELLEPTPSPVADIDCSDVVVAKVDQQPIYLKEILRFTEPREKNLTVSPGQTRWGTVQQVRQRELARYITQRLYTLAAAADPSVEATTDEIEEQYSRQVERFGGPEDLERFYQMKSEEIRNLLALSVSANRLREKHVVDKIEITAASKEEYYQLHLKDQFTIPAHASVRVVFRLIEGEVERASEEQKIQAIRTELEEALLGQQDKEQRLNIVSGFARAYSNHAPTRNGGGLWYLYGGHHIERQFWKFEDAVFESPEDVLSPVVPLDHGFCLFLLDSKYPPRQQTYTEVESQIEKIMWKEQFEALQQEWVDSLRKKYGVEVYEDALMCGQEKDKPAPVAAGLPGSGTDAGY